MPSPQYIVVSRQWLEEVACGLQNPTKAPDGDARGATMSLARLILARANREGIVE